MGDDRRRIEDVEAANRDAIDALRLETIAKDVRIVELVKEIEHLQHAREHAAVINQAKGVLMASMHIGPDAAFAVLVAASQRENLKLYLVAERIAAAQEETEGSHERGG